jgi:two-component system sensor histidine kinase SenX3
VTGTGYLGWLAAGVIGLVVGATGAAVLAWLLYRRARSRSVALMSSVLASLDNGIAVLDGGGAVVWHNPRAVELGVVTGEDGAVAADARARKAAEGARAAGEPVEVDLSPLSPRGRQPTAVVAEASPLSDEFVVLDAADESETVRLEATRRDFVANVSHELKTPVGALALLAEAVLDSPDDPDSVRHFSGKILHESRRIGTLVTELIALSRLQGAERLPELTVVEVDEVVEQARGRTSLAAESAGIDVQVDPDSGLLVHGDRTLLITALSNLVDNALSYSPHSSPVSISRRVVDGFVEVAVTDRGIGIAQKDQERVFERFYRVDKARSRATGGTGLGLAIVKHVAANHGGEVRLWSSAGVGSTFTVRIPRAGSRADPEPTVTTEPAAVPAAQT